MNLTNRMVGKLGIALVIAGGFSAMSQAAGAQVSFQQAVSDYSAGRYARALSEFSAYESANPNNALVHYYVALCQQATGHIEQAKTEFAWVATRADGNLKSMGAAGLAQLANAHTQASAPSHQIAMGMPATSTPTPSAPPPSKVKKVIEFYADW